MLFKEQIEKRREQEQAELYQAVGKFADEVGLKSRLKSSAGTDVNAVKSVLAALGIKDGYEWDPECIFYTKEEQLYNILIRKGIMFRTVVLDEQWWKRAVGPMLGYDNAGNWVALIPPHGKPDCHPVKQAICFYSSLPMRKIGVKDLLSFVVQSFQVRDVVNLLVLTGIVTIMGMLVPYVNKQLFDTVIPGGIKSDIVPVAALLVGVSIGIALFNLIRSWTLQSIKQLAHVRVEAAVMARTFFLKPKFFMKYTAGELSERIGSINGLCDVIGDTLISTSFTAIWSFVYIFQMNIYAQELVLPAMAVLLCQIVLIAIFFFFQRRINKKSIKASAKLASLVYDLMSGIAKIKLTGSHKRAFTRWFETYRESAGLNFNPPLIIKIFGALMVLLNMGGGIGLLYFMAVKYNIAPSDYIAFVTAYGMVSGALLELTQVVPGLAEMEPLMEQAKPILDAEPEVDEKSKNINSLSGAIEICHLSFRYSEDEPLVLDDLSLKISPGEYIGIVGKSGCGKSTLVRLLLGFETPLSGAIYYDNYDLKELDKSNLRQKIGTCLQSGSLFPGNIFSNLTITAPWSTMKDAWEAVRLVGMEQDIKELPMGMSTLISEGGGGFSGGQKQRLLIARALMNKPSILIFDEATSALDNISQKIVSDNLSGLGCTRIAIAHRLSTIRNCDRIIVMDNGRIAEEGTYDQLKHKGGLFAEMLNRQEI